VAYAEYADATDLNAAIAPRRVADSRVMRELLATVKQIAPKTSPRSSSAKPRHERSSSRR
jgi:hypothetical protein